MKAIVKTEPKVGAQLLDVPVPQIRDDEVLVKVQAAALCKSDVDVYEWTPLVAEMKLPLPLIMGHEFFGEIVETGGKVRGLKVGDRVVGETHIPCGYCDCCRNGNPHICINDMGVLGRNVNGCFAEYIKIPESVAIKMDDSMDPKQGSLMEPLATALHAITQAGGVSGKSVAILGCGAIGLMAIDLAKALGAVKIFGLDVSPKKLDAALKNGADVAINGLKEDMVEIIKDKTNGLGVDAAIDFTGNQRVINQMISAMRSAGTCVFVGMIDYPLTFENFMLNAVYKELKLTGIFGRRIFETWDLLNAILAKGKIDLEKYVNATVPLSAFDRGLSLAPEAAGRVVLIP